MLGFLFWVGVFMSKNFLCKTRFLFQFAWTFILLVGVYANKILDCYVLGLIGKVLVAEGAPGWLLQEHHLSFPQVRKIQFQPSPRSTHQCPKRSTSIQLIVLLWLCMKESITEKDAVQQLWERGEKMWEKQPWGHQGQRRRIMRRYSRQGAETPKQSMVQTMVMLVVPGQTMEDHGKVDLHTAVHGGLQAKADAWQEPWLVERNPRRKKFPGSSCSLMWE